MSCFVYDDREGHAGFVANPELSDLEEEDTFERVPVDPRSVSPDRPRPAGPAPRLRLDGRPLDLRAEGLLARIFQHETDHLRGMLYIDRLDDEGRRDVMRQLREFEVQRSEP